jgi:hypothetical protein
VCRTASQSRFDHNLDMKFKMFALIVSMLISARLGYACTCGGEHSPRIRFDSADIAFTGVVIEVNNNAVKLEVEKKYKGDVEKEVVLTRSEQETTCDIFFSKGDKYLVYAYEVKIGAKVVFMTDVCAGTHRYPYAKEDIKYLETPASFPDLGRIKSPEDKKARPQAKRKTKKR